MQPGADSENGSTAPNVWVCGAISLAVVRQGWLHGASNNSLLLQWKLQAIHRHTVDEHRGFQVRDRHWQSQTLHKSFTPCFLLCPGSRPRSLHRQGYARRVDFFFTPSQFSGSFRSWAAQRLATHVAAPLLGCSVDPFLWVAISSPWIVSSHSLPRGLKFFFVQKASDESSSQKDLEAIFAPSELRQLFRSDVEASCQSTPPQRVFRPQHPATADVSQFAISSNTLSSVPPRLISFTNHRRKHSPKLHSPLHILASHHHISSASSAHQFWLRHPSKYTNTPTISSTMFNLPSSRPMARHEKRGGYEKPPAPKPNPNGGTK
jgi:hypothetical protein